VADRPLIGPGSELQLTLDGGAVPHAEVLAETGALEGPAVDVDQVAAVVDVVDATLILELLDATPEAIVDDPATVNLYAVGERLAARAASPATRRQYSAIYRSFGDWLRLELGRPPLLGDVDADVVAAYGRHLETAGGRGGRPASLATRRIYMTMVRALARQAGLDAVADEVRAPRHQPGPPETLTDTDWANLLRVPDRRTQIGKRDYAILRALGDLGLRSAELRGMVMADIRRPRANSRNHYLYVRGKGGRDREVPIASETKAAIDAWLAVHPLARGRGLRDEEPIFVRLGRHRGSEAPEMLSAQTLGKLVRSAATAAGIPDRLGHPHKLRSYWATSLLDDGVPVHVVQHRLGHADMRTTSLYAAQRPEHGEDLIDVLERRHQAERRGRV
jgi:integrase/recombinase XerD